MRIARPIVFAVLALALPGAWAQTYKCLNPAGKVTYSSTACESLGLRDAGEVRDRMNTAPAQKVPPPAPQPKAVEEPKAAKAAEATPPERRCFKTAKGYRCNDKPGED